jgi:hypothetical protein
LCLQLDSVQKLSNWDRGEGCALQHSKSAFTL